MKVLILLSALLVALSVAVPASKDGLRLIRLSETEERWMTEEDVLRLIEHHVGFFDVTDYLEPVESPLQDFVRIFPMTPSQQSIVDPLLDKISVSESTKFLTSFSEDFLNRYYTSESGVAALQWLADHMNGIASRAGRSDVNCTLFQHSFPQPSVICSIMGQGLNADEVVVVGAHADSINSRSPVNGKAPGADDDGSGITSNVEIFRVLLESGFRPNRRIDFIGYAAEEVGLRGSQDVARTYKGRGEKVYAVYQNEMSGYVGSSRTITVLQDFVDSDLTRFTEALVAEYSDIPVKQERCGYGCSDHASWTSEGFPAVCTAEGGPYSFGNVNPDMHTDRDSIDKLDMEYQVQFTRVALAFAVELSLYQG